MLKIQTDTITVILSDTETCTSTNKHCPVGSLSCFKCNIHVSYVNQDLLQTAAH